MHTDGHRDVYRQLFIIEVLAATDDRALATDSEDLTILLHTLTRIHP
jgi:hypothetical protein